MISIFDPSLLFSAISAHSSKVLGLKTKSAHLDSASFHVDGRYDHDEKSSEIKITKGYTRDHQPDLNQVVLNLIVSNQNGIPLLMEAASGNSVIKCLKN